MIKIKNWSIVGSVDFYKAPEQKTIHLAGVIESHPTGLKGPIKTSAIEQVKGREVTTKSGTEYLLGNIEPKYRKWLRKNRPLWNWRKPITVI